MMFKWLLFICLLPLPGLAQNAPIYEPVQYLDLKVKVITDTSVYKGYFVKGTDSTIQLCTEKRYLSTAIMHIPVNSINELQLRNKTGNIFIGVSAVSIFGFILTAGLTTEGDINDDGETSFLELVWAAIEGTTSSNRHRRNRALIVGAAGGTIFMIAGLFASRKLSLSFPLNNREKYYHERKAQINNYTRF